jgi:hypothetical protein
MTEEMSASGSNESEDRAIDPSLHGQVYFQGALDGACFLYAVANAYKALATKKVSTTRWHAAVAHAPDPAGFLGATGATQLGHSEAQRLMESLLGEFADPWERFSIERLPSNAGVVEFCDSVSERSVVIFGYGGQTEFQNPANHIVWGVAVGTEPLSLLLACSTAFWARFLTTGQYSERHDAGSRRWSNDSITADAAVRIAPNFRWRITRE